MWFVFSSVLWTFFVVVCLFVFLSLFIRGCGLLPSLLLTSALSLSLILSLPSLLQLLRIAVVAAAEAVRVFIAVLTAV